MTIREISKTNGVISTYLISSRTLYECLQLPIEDLEIADDGLTASISLTPRLHFQAYENVMHGGMVTMLLDAVGGVFALYHASFEGKIALTVKMEALFIQKVQINEPCRVVATFGSSKHGVLFLTATIFQKIGTAEEKLATTAEFKFRIA